MTEGDHDEVPAFQARLTSVRSRIAAAAERSGRNPGDVRLIAVSKLIPVPRVAAALAAGQRDLGENYIKELAEKRDVLEGNPVWHFLGALQSGTAVRVADLADVVHGLASLGAARKLARRAAANGRPIACLVQVDLAERGTSVAPQDLERALRELATLEGIDLTGLMTLPPEPDDPDDADHGRPYFRRLAELLETHRSTHAGLRELSMGMSLDYEVAVEEGATMVRVGTALFGQRPDQG